MTNIYVVRLTEPAHNWLVGLAADVDTSWMSPGNKDIAREASSALESARREHPERQEVLEEVAAAAESYRDSIERAEGYITTDVVNDEERIDKALDKFRSLEGK